MKQTEIGKNAQGMAGKLAVSIGIGCAVVLLLLALCALAVCTGFLAEAPLAVMASGSLTLGSLLAAFRAARCSPGQRLLWALAAGGGLLLCLVLLSFVCCGGPVEGARVAVNAGCVLFASLLGGVLGAAGRKKKRKR